MALIADICRQLCEEEGAITGGPGFSFDWNSKLFTLQETTAQVENGSAEVGVAPLGAEVGGAPLGAEVGGAPLGAEVGGLGAEVGGAPLDTKRLEELEEDLNESFDIEEIESSVSTCYGFSDSDDDVIEVLSDEEEEEETRAESEVIEEGSEVEEDSRLSVTSEEDSEIERLKVSV